MRGLGVLSSPFRSAPAFRETARRWTGAGQEWTKRLPEPWHSGFLPAGESSYLPEDTIPISESRLATSVTRRCQMLILFYCTEVSKPSHLLCLSIKGALFFMGHSHPWDVSVFLQHFKSKLAGFPFFFLWSTWKPPFAILSRNHSGVLHATSCDFCCPDQHYSLFFFFFYYVGLIHCILFCIYRLYTLGQRFCHQCVWWHIFLNQ